MVVEAVAILEIQRLGLRGGDPQSIAGGDRARAAALVQRLVDRGLPEVMAASTTRSPAGRLAMLADPPCNPPAYHALTLGMLARAVQLLGDRAGRDGRRLLVDAARASWALMAPDGDVASFARGQEQSWASAFTAFGVAVAAGAAPSVWRPRFAAVANRATERLQRVHGGGPWGL